MYGRSSKTKTKTIVVNKNIEIKSTYKVTKTNGIAIV